jgi:acyl dehydratase
MEITAAAGRSFAEATNDTNEAFTSGELVPPLYAIVLVLKTMVEAKNSVTSAFAFHGEHDLNFIEHLRPGMVVVPSATVVGVRQRSAGVVIIIRITIHSEEGHLLNEQYFTSFVSGGVIEESVGQDAPRRVPPHSDGSTVLHELTLRLDSDQTRRFAVASDDWDPYTLEKDAAQRLGFPTIIVHGPCTMAFAGRAVVETVCGGDARKLRRLSMRLSRPVFLTATQSLTARIFPIHMDSVAQAYAFEMTDRDQRTVVKNGWADVRR